VIIVGGGAGAEDHWRHQAALLDGLDLTRTLVTEPANILYPESFVARCRQAMEGLGIEFEVLDEAAMEKLGMHALLGVGRGSEKRPFLMAMRWRGGADPDATPAVLIGKGITFDTGGISIKPAQGMEAMKWDMGGAGAVAGAMRALAGRKAKANVVGVVALAENMPDGRAQRPGDVVTSMSGPDDRGDQHRRRRPPGPVRRHDLGQRQYQPKVMVDLATLTGAMIISLGHEYGGMFSNDDGLAASLAAAGNVHRRQACGGCRWARLTTS
jgi:leucyl aminopeptidase